MKLDLLCQRAFAEGSIVLVVKGIPMVVPDLRRQLHREPREVFEAWVATGTTRGVASALGMHPTHVRTRLASMGIR